MLCYIIEKKGTTMFVEQLTESDKREILFQALKILEKNHSNLQHECDNAHIEKVSNSDEVFFIYTFQSDLNIVGGVNARMKSYI